ncbi:MAG: methyltransferase domain-containing protein [Opitutales bacterium]
MNTESKHPIPTPAMPPLANGPVRTAKHLLLKTMSKLVPPPLWHWLDLRVRQRIPSPGRVRFGDLSRVTPISREFGFDRGLPVDRYYIEKFLVNNAGDIRGRILEIGDNEYTLRFGGNRVVVSDVLHVRSGNPKATLIGDLACGDHLPADAFDCIVLTQTLHLIYDVRAALTTCFRILKPGGVLLITTPGCSQVECGEWRETWYWSFTVLSLRKLIEEACFAASVEAYGNVLAGVALLHGLATNELSQPKLDHRDPLYPVLVTGRALKPRLPE